MGFGSSFKKAIGGVASAIPGGKKLADIGISPIGWDPFGITESSIDSYNREREAKGLGTLTREQITTANLFSKLTRSQQKDLLLNNPNINTPEGGQSYDPYTNTITLNESDFTKNERLRQEEIAKQLSSSISGYLPSSNEEIQNATFNRGKALIDPIITQQRKDLAQQLADQGVPAGSEQYTEAMNRLDDSIARQYTDLSQASIATAEQQRAQRFNEIASLLGRSQVGTGASFAQNQASFSGLDLFGAEQAQLNRSLQDTLSRRANSTAKRNALYQALGGAGSSLITAIASDIRLKTNVKLIDKSESGLNIYQFEYKNKNLGEGIYQGVMAQELLKNNQDALVMFTDGYFGVDYSKIDVNFKRIQ